ncbi:MAG: DedA protein, partial [uncultured Thermomicrobiales bacterium]
GSRLPGPDRACPPGGVPGAAGVRPRGTDQDRRVPRPLRDHLRRDGAAGRLLPPRRQPPLHRRVPRLAGRLQHLAPGADLLRGRGDRRRGRLRVRAPGRAAPLHPRALPPVPAGAPAARGAVLPAAGREGRHPRPVPAGSADLRTGDRRGRGDALLAVRGLQRDRRRALGRRSAGRRLLPRQRHPERRPLPSADHRADHRRLHRAIGHPHLAGERRRDQGAGPPPDRPAPGPAAGGGDGRPQGARRPLRRRRV